MTTGHALVARARLHIGEKYVNRQVPKDDPNWKGPWDCAEFMSWLVFQETGSLYGCTDNSADPKTADAYTGAWQRDASDLGRTISVAEAAGTAGAFLLRFPPGRGKMGHIALSDGRGGTVEAAGRALGVVAGRATGRRWDIGVLAPGIDYGDRQQPIAVEAPSILYAQHGTGQDPNQIKIIQRALAAKGFDPGEIDGAFGPRTSDATAAFQRSMGLIEDGEVGTETAKQLGTALAINVAAASPPSGAHPRPSAIVEREGVVGPLIGIAAAVLPEIIKAIASDRGGTVAGSVANIVQKITGTSDAAAAQQKVQSDPSVAAELRLKLAEIAVEQERAWQQSQIELLRLRLDQETKSIQASLDNTQGARQSAIELARIGGFTSKGPMFVTISVIVGFFAILILLFFAERVAGFSKDSELYQIVNITIGALTAAFATVVNFWLGSSQGSRGKDVANVALQSEQTQQTKEIITSQAAIVEAARQQPAGGPVKTAQKRTPLSSNFERCVDLVLMREGGYVNDPNDKGGPTNLGITLATLQAHRNDQTLTADDVKKLTREEACEIYRTLYWNVLRCGDLPAGVDLMAFDFGVNAGTYRSAKLLQQSVGAAADGAVGPATIAATNAAPPANTIRRFTQAKLDFYGNLSGFERYGRGWTNRARAIEKEALAMIEPVALVA